MDGHRRYAEDPDPQWYSEPAPYEPGEPERRPDEEYRRLDSGPAEESRYPLTGGLGSLAPAESADPYTPGFADTYQPGDGFFAEDPLTSGSIGRLPVEEPPREPARRPALDAIRVPLRGPEYPAVRPGGAGPSTEAATTSTGSIPAQRSGAPGGHALPEAAPFATPASRPGMDLGTAPLGGDGLDRSGSFAATGAPTAPLGTTAPLGPSAPLGPTSPSGLSSPVGPTAPLGGSGALAGSGALGGAGRSGGTTYPSAPSSPAYDQPTGFVPPVGVRTAEAPAPSDGVYRTRRPVTAVLLAIVTAVLMVPVVRLLLDAALADRPTAAGIVPSVLLTLGLPLTGIGLYAVAGLGRSPDRSAWTRPPLGYLAVGLVLLLAAALATA